MFLPSWGTKRGFPEAGAFEVVVEAVGISVNQRVAAETTERVVGGTKSGVSDPTVAPRFQDSQTDGWGKFAGDFASVLDRFD